MLELSFRTNYRELERKLDLFARQQLPTATAMALTNLAHLAQDAERANLAKVLNKPTPFTVASVRFGSARPDNLEAIVYVKDIAAAYLEPYEFGGRNKPVGRGTFLEPHADEMLNQYGNLPRAKLAELKARSDVFIGRVKTRSGVVMDGVWQRVAKSASVTRRGRTRITRRNLNTSGQLKLLIRFTDPHPVRQHLGWFDVAKRVIEANYSREMQRALSAAIASAR